MGKTIRAGRRGRARAAPSRTERSLRWLGLLAFVFLCACDGSTLSTTVPAELPSPRRVAEYSGTWEYRLGDSPPSGESGFLWAQPGAAHDDGEWRPTHKTMNPPGRRGQSHLWLRTRLTGPEASQPVLRLPWVEQRMEAYLDGVRVAQSGPMDPPAADEFAGQVSIDIPLGPAYQGKLLAMRFYSPHRRIGTPPRLLIGERSEIHTILVRDSLPAAIVTSGIMAAGLVLLALFFVQRTESDLLLYSLALILLGIYVLIRVSVVMQILQWPQWRYYIELLSLCLLCGLITALLVRMLRVADNDRVTWQAWAFFAAAPLGAILVATGALHVVTAAEILKVAVLLALLPLLLRIVQSLARGDLYGRIIAIGCLLASLVTVHIALQELRFLPRTGFVTHYAAAAFAGTLGLVLLHRFRSVQRRLADYGSMMQLNLAAARELRPERYAQHLLSELLRLLGARRVDLFTCADDLAPLALLASRDESGERQPTVESAALLRTPAMLAAREQGVAVAEGKAGVPQPVGSSVDPHGVLYCPLLSQGATIGVLVLRTGDQGLRLAELQLLQGIARQIAALLLAQKTRDLERESEQAQRLLREQELLLGHIQRLAGGDLKTPISLGQTSELVGVALHLDGLRRDMLAEVERIDARRQELQQLNETLRFQLELRIQELLSQALGSQPSSPKEEGPGELSPGAVLADDYQVIRLLGQGASGLVYEVLRATDRRSFAAKVISSHAQRERVLQYAKEALILSRLKDPHIVSIVDIDISEQGKLFLVMELVQGKPLDWCISEFHELPRALALFAQITAGLQAVHEHGIVHRDLKPANILIDQSTGTPHAKLSDFGISMFSDLNATVAREIQSLDRNKQGLLVGSPMYLAPELTQGSQEAQPPADIFSFGVLAYETLTGTLPFAVPPVVLKFQGKPLTVPSLSDLRPDVPESIAQAVARCLAPEPADRPTAHTLRGVFSEGITDAVVARNYVTRAAQTCET